MILPKDNEKDLKDIPESVREDLQIVLVESMDEVLKVALERPIGGDTKAEESSDRDTEESFQERQPPDVIKPDEGNRPGVH